MRARRGAREEGRAWGGEPRGAQVRAQVPGQAPGWPSTPTPGRLGGCSGGGPESKDGLYSSYALLAVALVLGSIACGLYWMAHRHEQRNGCPDFMWHPGSGTCNIW